MRKPLRPIFLSVRLLAMSALLLTLAGCGKPPARPAASLSEKDRAELGKYEEIRAALASDDLRTAKRAATDLATLTNAESGSASDPAIFKPAAELANIAALDRARDSFKALSAVVIPKAAGVEGFYVMTCPMTTNGDWLQKNPKVDNPYMGKIMRDCGGIKK
jgi:Cu(I)/Ag(I) efflux system membrane fusion protein